MHSYFATFVVHKVASVVMMHDLMRPLVTNSRPIVIGCATTHVHNYKEKARDVKACNQKRITLVTRIQQERRRVHVFCFLSDCTESHEKPRYQLTRGIGCTVFATKGKGECLTSILIVFRFETESKKFLFWLS